MKTYYYQRKKSTGYFTRGGKKGGYCDVYRFTKEEGEGTSLYAEPKWPRPCYFGGASLYPVELRTQSIDEPIF